MKISDIFEGSAGLGRRKRPPKTLWFNMKELWGHDIKSRYPNAELRVYKDEDKYVAVDVENKMCYGVWAGKRNTGCSYYKARPILASVTSKVAKNLVKIT